MSDVSMSSKRVPLANAPFPSRKNSVPAENGRGFSPLSYDSASLDVDIELVGDMASAAVLWSVFEKLADATPFQTFGWLDHWQRHVGIRQSTLPVIVIGRGRDGDMLFMLPLAIKKHGTLRRLIWLGMELADYSGPLLAESFSHHPAADNFAAVWELVLASLRSDARYHFDLVDLAKMPEMVGAQKNPFLHLNVTPNRSGAYLATLGTDWQSYFNAKRSASTRKTLRKKQRQLESYGKISFVEDVDAQDAARTLETLIEQKSGAFARMGVENLFARSGYPEFYEAVVTDPQMRDMVHVCHLDVGTTMAATSVALRFRDRYYLILSSYHAGEISRFGPGRTHLHELLRHTIEKGFRYFDFTIGDEPYKLDWSDAKLTLYDHLAATSFLGKLVAAMVIFQRRAIRFIKQSPLLWSLVGKVRAAKGRLRGRGEGQGDSAD